MNYIHKQEKNRGIEIGKPPKVPDHLRAQAASMQPVENSSDQNNQSIVENSE